MRQCVVCVCASLLAACGGVQATPIAPSPVPPPVVSPPPVVATPGPHFALELVSLQPVTLDGDSWRGTVTILPDRTMINPILPVRVVVTCGADRLVRAFSAGEWPFGCLLPVGRHGIGAVAEMADGSSYPTSITAEVIERPAVTLLMDAWATRAEHDTFVAFSVQTIDADRYVWDFGDGHTDRTHGPSTSHRYLNGLREYRATVTALNGAARTVGRGSIVGRW